MMQEFYQWPVIMDRMFSTVLLFPTVKQASKFYRFVRTKHDGVAYVTQNDCEILFETTDKSLFRVCLDKMYELGVTEK